MSKHSRTAIEDVLELSLRSDTNSIEDWLVIDFKFKENAPEYFELTVGEFIDYMKEAYPEYYIESEVYMIDGIGHYVKCVFRNEDELMTFSRFDWSIGACNFSTQGDWLGISVDLEESRRLKWKLDSDNLY
jgi:hypothetical protein